ncbi:class I SAM-dependent methyltransferase [Psychroflexus sp. ALD_RP9]|uniref:class I SAM-dependent methyltransferase n=1 Tax=Psychroflexus sp. ALD_RP9 TaxID=2777186 RepID=UPI001A8D3E9F|nr:class I SAM-dependent methyltransferase [Psychroflexus sp. ALD_RP9]QSS96889.1 methyltransferase domain-containing protein [Psychroflexus sp. ALD_RP9]
MSKINPEWYKAWFNSEYYHILYNNRNQTEAHAFVKKLFEYLNLPKAAKVLDLACGRGRHAQFIAHLGYDVLGIDLSENNIKFAQTHAHEHLKFKVHDMTIPLQTNFDAVLNLFTSFGYFESTQQNFNTLKAIKQNLKPNGIGVIDFLNEAYLREHLIPSSTVEKNNLTFHIKRWIEDSFVYKEIRFTHESQNYCFYERVKLITKKEFEAYFKELDLKITAKFGNYNLDDFDFENSERLILVYQA